MPGASSSAVAGAVRAGRMDRSFLAAAGYWVVLEFQAVGQAGCEQRTCVFQRVRDPKNPKKVSYKFPAARGSPKMASKRGSPGQFEKSA